ncbi:adenosylcobalamin-dependent ribonucleoside-diphosphate reductase [Dokdonella immobilis]|uniref:Vitamin B12-dependent ribonucleotide reductase n=1 Tax=Dokdonella immobilis TaxID=578942 RepID=A0A1I4ZB82_9GAMM|nr:adenosylcobalamin-dependent ribonucleoside-diphosphate reductase [Dokdonella immobilis]SFN47526.1 ribonucleoside-diphosphate reductase class II [Dokdonella immobilis]
MTEFPGPPNADDPIRTALAHRIWTSRYRRHDADGRPEADVRASWRRVAHALASVEKRDQDATALRFNDLMSDFRFLPGGRVLAGASAASTAVLFNCFVGARPDGSLQGMLDSIDEAARITLAGGGVGIDFSGVPPHAAALETGADLRGGPLPLLPLWDALCAALSAGRFRHGAMMGTLRCDHPDLPAFLDARKGGVDLAQFTLSVLVDDAFMHAVRHASDWPLVFPTSEGDVGDSHLARSWPAFDGPRRACRRWGQVSAAGLWQRIAQCSFERSEPGLLFIDTIRRLNPLAYAEEIAAVNPCSEVPLPAHGACDLGSFNLTRFVHDPFTAQARFDREALLAGVADAVRLLDNVYELSAFPTPRHAEVARASRRIGLGITGLADTLVLLGLRYDSEPARRFAGDLMRELCIAAYRASVALAREKGAFPAFDGNAHVRGEFVARLPDDLRADIARHGLRNSHLLAIAPAGSISLLANGVSSGLEPLPALRLQRNVRLAPQTVETVAVESHALTCFRALFGANAPLPAAFVDVRQIAPEDQIRMQAVLQQHVDNAIAKTVTIPVDFPPQRHEALFRLAHSLGLKGCTTYRAVAAAGHVYAADDCRLPQACRRD